MPLLAHPNVILTPHLGAATTEAQEKVAVLIAEQICDFLKKGTIRNSVNFPSVSGELLPTLKPFLTLAERLGAFHGQLLRNPVRELKVDYFGEVGKLSTAPITISVLKGLLQYQTEEVNLVNARMVAEERGIKVSESKTPKSEPYASLLKVTVVTGNGESSVSGDRVRRGAEDRPDRRLPHRGGALRRDPDAAEPGRSGRGRPDRHLPRGEGDQHRRPAAGPDRGRRNRRYRCINVDNAIPENVLAQLRASFRTSWTPNT